MEQKTQNEIYGESEDGLMQKHLIYENLERSHYFRKIFVANNHVNNHLIVWENNWWQVLTLYQT